VQCSKL